MALELWLAGFSPMTPWSEFVK